MCKGTKFRKPGRVKLLFSISDVALFKKTSQSSNFYDYGSHLAADGNLDTRMDQLSCAHTKADAEPWWMVDFGKVYNVTGVEITNRGDCCGDRLKNFDVTVDGNLYVYPLLLQPI